MWEEAFLLLLHGLEAVVASQCWQGATFPEAVVSPAVHSSGIVRVPDAASLPQCVAACCELPGYELAWLFKGRCYALNCQQGADCRPQERPGADSVLAFLRRASPTLALQSLERSPEDDLEALKDLARVDGPRRGFWDPGMLDVEDSEGGLEDRGGAGFNQSEAAAGPTQGSGAQIRASSEKPSRGGNRTRTPADPDPDDPDPAVERTTQSGTASATDSAHHQNPSAQPDAIRTTGRPGRPLMSSLGNPVEQVLPTQKLDVTAGPSRVSEDPPEPTADASKPPQAAPTASQPLVPAMTSDPTGASPPPTPAADVGGSNRGPLAVVGPDRRLVLPLSHVWLDGSGSTDDRGVSSYRWEVVSGPSGMKLEEADRAVAKVTGVQAGRYTFKLTVSDQEGATDSALLSVWIEEGGRSLQGPRRPPVAHASGSHCLTLPNNSLVLRGSVTDGDQSQVHYLWTRDSQSPAAGAVLFGSQTRASLYLADLVEGTYLFQLRVTDAQGRSSSATATVEVRPEPGGGEQVELEMLVPVSQVSVAQRDTVVRQLAALIHVLNGDVQVRALQGRSHISTVLRFSIRGPGGPGHAPGGPLPSSRLVALLRSQLLGEKSDYLLFRVLRVDSVVCLLRCSGRGQCDPITKQCACDPSWTESPVRRYLGDGESNCDWRVLYVILSSFVLMVSILVLSWFFLCCCSRRRRTKVRKKTRYTILDNVDEQERVELRPRFSIKHRSTEHNSSLMMSESELDSDQDAVFSRDRRRNRVGAQAARNGNAFG
ncbi:dyslexia-associated protein KIAA0319 [Odontesthes bonariensis]|uniref:dyslexia-associated protein KIAA0319 n=1 Tax=Odontesthes bonariensis TaxID=219752 RepID=UPI003F587B10